MKLFKTWVQFPAAPCQRIKLLFLWQAKDPNREVVSVKSSKRTLTWSTGQLQKAKKLDRIQREKAKRLTNTRDEHGSG